MKKCFQYVLCLWAVAFVVFWLLFAVVANGNAILAIIFGSVYRKVGEAAFAAKNYPETLAVYKAADKPFLIIGPCLFREGDHEDDAEEDFFFVNRKQVIRTATDKGGDLWGRTFGHLHMIDDLSDCEVLRAPLWDDLKCDKNSSVRYDGATDSYVYSFTIERNTVPVKLTIPAKFFTPDMDRARSHAFRNRKNISPRAAPLYNSPLLYRLCCTASPRCRFPQGGRVRRRCA